MPAASLNGSDGYRKLNLSYELRKTRPGQRHTLADKLLNDVQYLTS